MVITDQNNNMQKDCSKFMAKDTGNKKKKNNLIK